MEESIEMREEKKKEEKEMETANDGRGKMKIK